MPMNQAVRQAFAASILTAFTIFAVPTAVAQPNSGDPQRLSTGQLITPLAPNGASFQPLNPGLADDPLYTAGQAVTTAVSPDAKTLLILTSGYNLMNFTTGTNAGNTNPADSNEFVFVFDISKPEPIQKQVIQVPSTYSGIAFSPNGEQFYVTGDDWLVSGPKSLYDSKRFSPLKSSQKCISIGRKYR